MMAQLQPWQNFYMLLGGASATLVGLMFIAISLGQTRWTPEERPILTASFSAFMSPTFIHFVYVLVTAAVVFVPTLSETVLGGLLVLTGIGSLGHIARNLPFFRERYRVGSIDRSDLWWYSLMPSVGYILYLDAGIGLLRAAAGGISRGQALNALAAASVLLLVIGVRNAWDLVVYLALRRLDTPADRRP
ncbi:MAG TPA: hypothetical protein VGX75_03335 [bacterium]|nr:hypothetical protein [bacterium]